MSKKGEKKEKKKEKKKKHKVSVAVGGIIRKVFGKARWHFLGIAVSVLLIFLIGEIDSDGRKTLKWTSKPGGETKPVADILMSSVNRDGRAAFIMKSDSLQAEAVLDIETGEQICVQYPRITEGEDYKMPSNYVYSDDGKMYAVVTDYTDSKSTTIARERVVEIGEDFKIAREFCTVNYDPGEGLQISKLSGLCLSEGKVNFACIDCGETRLYSIDPGTQALSISDPYPTAPDGTFTFAVIPLSDSFLLMRSDGNVYRTRFGEPLGESIFRFEENVLESGGFFRFAAAVGDKLYVYRYYGKGRIYSLENGALTEVLDLHSTENGDRSSMLISMDCSRPEGSDKDLLVLSLNNGVVTFDGETTSDKDLSYFLKNHPLFYVWKALQTAFFFCVGGLVINLIIRKKTLLYKQIMLTLPVLLIPAIAAAINIYLNSEEENTKNVEKELDLVCRIGVSALDGYDYSGLGGVNSDTGAAARRLQNRLSSFDPDNTKYIFSVVKRTDENNAAVLVRTDWNTMPYYFSESIVSRKEILEKTGDSGNYLFKEIQGMMSDNATYSEIYVLGRLNAPGSGEYYLKVKTNSWNFWTMRRDLLFELLGYLFIIICSLTVITIITSMYITRTIKKATKAVSTISGGDLTARIDYRSKDELGEICSQVNGMAQSLQTLFAEKDRTERFYYKFVPEKFRELLGKDSFTDLELGDASSRELTVLFFDIRAFSINSEIMTAKENFEFVNVIYGKAGPIVRSHGGFIDKYIGDAVMALFENAEDAVRCGIELYKAIVLDRSTAEAIHISDLNIGIGIHSGMARIGIVGESERLSGTVISDTVNLSSRLESLTKQYKTAMLISKDTVDRMADPDSLGLRYLGIVQVAGVNEVKAVYEVLDCLPEEEKARRSGNALELREAIRLFHLGRRGEALDILRKLTDSDRGDHVTEMYREYIGGMSDEDKGNVFRFVRK